MHIRTLRDRAAAMAMVAGVVHVQVRSLRVGRRRVTDRGRKGAPDSRAVVERRAALEMALVARVASFQVATVQVATVPAATVPAATVPADSGSTVVRQAALECQAEPGISGAAPAELHKVAVGRAAETEPAKLGARLAETGPAGPEVADQEE